MILRVKKAAIWPPGLLNIVTLSQIWRVFAFFDKGFVDFVRIASMIASGKEIPAGNKQGGD